MTTPTHALAFVVFIVEVAVKDAKQIEVDLLCSSHGWHTGPPQRLAHDAC